MASKANWEFRIYENEENFDKTYTMYNDTGMSKKEAIWEAKRFVKNNYQTGMVVKIQTSDREHIEIYSPVNRFGEIIFTKKV